MDSSSVETMIRTHAPTGQQSECPVTNWQLSVVYSEHVVPLCTTYCGIGIMYLNAMKHSLSDISASQNRLFLYTCLMQTTHFSYHNAYR